MNSELKKSDAKRYGIVHSLHRQSMERLHSFTVIVAECSKSNNNVAQVTGIFASLHLTSSLSKACCVVMVESVQIPCRSGEHNIKCANIVETRDGVLYCSPQYPHNPLLRVSRMPPYTTESIPLPTGLQKATFEFGGFSGITAARDGKLYFSPVVTIINKPFSESLQAGIIEFLSSLGLEAGSIPEGESNMLWSLIYDPANGSFAPIVLPPGRSALW